MIQLPDIQQPIINEDGTVDKFWYDILQDIVTKLNSNTVNIESNDVELADHELRITALETP